MGKLSEAVFKVQLRTYSLIYFWSGVAAWTWKYIPAARFPGGDAIFYDARVLRVGGGERHQIWIGEWREALPIRVQTLDILLRFKRPKWQN